MIARFLIHTSAASRMPVAAVADRLAPLITGGVVATCDTLDAEPLYSATEYEQVRNDRREAYEYQPTDDGHWQRAGRSTSWRRQDGIERSASPTF